MARSSLVEMSKIKASVVEGLGQIVGSERVLADVEDVYVYSFEHFFRGRQYPRVDVVVRVGSDEEVRRVLELAEREGFSVVRRSVGRVEVFGGVGSPVVLVDDVVASGLESVLVEEEGGGRGEEVEEKIFRAGHGTFRNFALGLRSLFAKAPASRCLECATCSGYCTVSPAFGGVETWSSKGRALLIRGFSSGELQASRKLVDVVYTCSLCGLCFAECFEDTQVRKAVLEARRRLAERGLAPELFSVTAKNILETGDVAGASAARRFGWMRGLSVKPVEGADVLYWVGCVVAGRTPNTARAVVDVLGKAGVGFSLLSEKEGCCGYVLLASGLWNEARDVALRVVERVEEAGARVLVTSCAGCYYTFSRLYPEVLNVEMPCEIKHASQFAYDLIKNGRLELGELDVKVAYHDPCSLGRHSGVFDEPRGVLKAVPGLRLVEMPLSRRRARCCGAGGGLWSFNYGVSVDSAYVRLAEDVVPLGVDALATACPTCQVNLRHASVKKLLGIKIYDIMEIIAKSLSLPHEIS